MKTRSTVAATIASTRPPGPLHCWLCGQPGERLRADIHLVGHLCARCWDLQPRGWSDRVRAAAALFLAAEPGPRPLWYGRGLRDGWLERTAHTHGITAWHDVPRDTPPPTTPFGWIPDDVLAAAAADLAALETEFQRSLIPPDRRP
ncbi:hypothetical protein [Streptomyces sp. XY533]|uniref:hypothetical protein n=1 Tax=Streptomyces sp. XY533 TaxID=1519481 RepID=UPI0006B019A5|nr:hypothetical protein [Streptomyces sp. XY533]KOU99095.1 hypothetical protein ADK92_12895 [Streptomyces sp. XY533]